MPRPAPTRIRKLLDERDLLVRQLAAGLGINRVTASQIITRRRSASQKTRHAIAAMLGVAEDELFDDDHLAIR